jgi:hypothetical protein
MSRWLASSVDRDPVHRRAGVQRRAAEKRHGPHPNLRRLLCLMSKEELRVEPEAFAASRSSRPSITRRSRKAPIQDMSPTDARSFWPRR